MIPKYNIPEITEFMTGYVVDTYSSDSPTMNVFIPVLMLDTEASKKTFPVPIDGKLFVSKETVRTSPSVTGMNYITATVSPAIKATRLDKIIEYNFHDSRLPFDIPMHRHEFIPVQYPVGTKVLVYIPRLDLHKASIVPQ